MFEHECLSPLAAVFRIKMKSTQKGNIYCMEVRDGLIYLYQLNEYLSSPQILQLFMATVLKPEWDIKITTG